MEKSECKGRQLSRDHGCDLLRAAGLFLIIFAHANPPAILANLRSFDVPLMVFVSGITLSLQPSKVEHWISFLKKRFLRLLLPVWAFLSFFFLFFFCFFSLTGNDFPFSSHTIIDSYLLGHGIGYVWIIKVFLLVALSAPAAVRLNRNISADWLYLTIVLLVGYIYSVIQLSYIGSIWIKYLFSYLIPYSCIFAIGLRIRFMSSIKIFILWAILVSPLVIFSIVGNNVILKINNYKYPPRLYYLSYGAAMSLLVYSLVDYINLKGILMRFVVFVSKSSLWIYLWHIFVLYMWHFFSPMWAEQFLVKFFLVTSLSIFLVKLQIRVATLGLELVGWTGRKRDFVRMAFL